MIDTNKGKFIVIYGINNLGKSTQAKLLVDRLNEAGIKAKYLKYPIYQIKPSGVIINNYLRNNNTYKLSAREAQTIYAINRSHFEPELKRLLDSGVNIIAEDYTGTGLAWGLAEGISWEYLMHINSNLIKEDLAFLFDGQPHKNQTKTNHLYEKNESITNYSRETHLRLADEFNWIKVNANQAIREINDKLFKFVYRFIQNQNEPHLRPDFLKNHHQNNQSTLKVRRLSPIAKLPYWNPNYNGFEIYSADYMRIKPGELVEIDTALKILIPRNMHAFIWNTKNAKLTMSLQGQTNHLKISHTNLSSLYEHLQPGELVARLHLHRSQSINIEEKEF